MSHFNDPRSKSAGVGSVGLQFSLVLPHPDPTPTDLAFVQLQKLVAHLIRNSRRPHPLGVTAYTPAAFGDTYPALYLRDFTYMAESAPECVPQKHVHDIIALFIANLSPGDLCPERISNEGEVIYVCHGGRPAADSPLFLLKLCAAHLRHGGDPAFLTSVFPSLVRTLATVPVESATGLVWINPAAPHTAYGFTDSIAITGRHLFCSLLRLEACGILADFSERFGDDAKPWRQQAAQIRQNLDLLWSADHALFLAGSQDCRQADIWGSAYACVIGAVDDARRGMIAASLLARRERFLLRGQVRHLLLPEFWQRLIGAEEWAGPGLFQNGPYWGTATGWVAEVLEHYEPGRGFALLRELAADFAAHGVWECIGADGYARVANNLSSVCLPYASWKRLHSRTAEAR